MPIPPLGEMLGELGSVEDLDLFPEETARDPAQSADLQEISSEPSATA